MKRVKELLAILYVFILLVNEPHLTKACVLEEGIIAAETYAEYYSVFDSREYDSMRIYYMLNGGENHVANESVVTKSELPLRLEVPTREGYNFSGWYTDSSYHHKVTDISTIDSANIVLYAKWTAEIDSYYNVEMYSYQTSGISKSNEKELRNCSYSFVDELSIPGMPATRAQDYRDDIISTESQCLQGLCFTPEYILMTAYSESGNIPGALMIFDRTTGEYILTLLMDEKSHVGGLTYDGENIWVCHSHSDVLERISYSVIQEVVNAGGEGCVDVSPFTDEYVIENTPSCITWYGGRLWVATYSSFFHSKMVSYTFDEEEDELVALSEYKIPAKVQGVAFDEDGTVYLSTSLGRNNSSYLKGYSSLLALDQKPDEPITKVEMPPCSEGISIADSNMYVVFESANEKYFEGTDGKGMSTSPIDKLLQVEVASLW